MRKFKAATTAVIALSLVLSTFAPAFAANVTKVKIDTKVSKMTVNESKKLKVTVAPKAVKVTWKTSDKKVATVANDGTVKALAAGTVKITATAGNKSNSITIKVGKAAAKAEAKTEAKTENTVPKNALLYADFAQDSGLFTPRGDCDVTWTDKKGSDGKPGYLEVTRRSTAWSGTVMDITDLVKPGKTYHVVGWVKYTEGAATETFKITSTKNSETWPAVTGDVEVEKGKWTKLEGTLTVDADATTTDIYFETSTNETLSFDCDTMIITEE